MARLVTRSELSRIAGVSPAAITKACKNALTPACDGSRVDLDHPATVAYLASKGRAPTAAAPAPKKRGSKTTTPRPKPGAPAKRKRSETPEETPEAELEEVAAEGMREIDGLEHLTLEKLVTQYGTLTRFRDWLEARKKLADLRSAELKNDEAQGRLIDRELVRSHVFSALEAGNRRLLGDTPKTIARRLYALARSETAVEEAEQVVREILSSQLRPVKAAAARALRRE